MKKLRYLKLLLFLLTALQSHLILKADSLTSQESFALGEKLFYQIHYGWLDAGVATMKISDQLHEFQGNPCYQIQVSGESRGMLHVFLKMKNEFGSYLDCSKLISQGSYRYIHEGKYRKNERVSFEHDKKLATVERLSEQSGEVIDTVFFPICDHIQDMVSNWYVLRTRDFKNMQVGEIWSSPVFFDDNLYENFSIQFLGRKKIKTKLGYIEALVLAPIVPFNTQGGSIFANENSVEVFLSDDENKIPLKIKLKLILGVVEIDLIKHQGLKQELKVTKFK